MTLTRETMLRHMLQSDPRADGLFITGVVSTGIYCLPSCRARKPRPQNVVFHATPASARAAGLRPCQRCRPDEQYDGDHYTGLDAQEVGLQALLNDFDPASLRHASALARHLGVSSSKLNDLFRLHLHTTPAEWLTRQRIIQARRRLLNTSRPIAEIAFEVGFESLSAFGEQFRRWSAMTPQAYRDLPRGQPFTLRLPPDYPTTLILHDLGRDPRNPTSRVAGLTYTTALRLADQPVLIRMEFSAGQVTCTASQTQAMNWMDWLLLHRTLLRLLGLHADPARFEAQILAQPTLAPLVHGRHGLRIPLYADLFDGLVWAICGQQVNFPFACTLRRRLIRQAGEVFADGLYAPLRPEEVAALDVAAMQALGFTGTRARVLLDVAQRVADGRLNLQELADGTFTRAQQTLRAVPGIGPWTAGYVLLRAFGAQDAVPWGDTALRSALQRFFRLHTRPDQRETERLMALFGPHRSLATFHLWQVFHQGGTYETT